jgi:CTP:molybdopterin cytidylyltransferase MocA
VIAVLGAAAEEVRKTSDLASTIVVINEDWPTGMGSSLGHGLRAAASTDADAVAVILVDLPGLTTAAVEFLIASASPGMLAVATYGGKRGHPVVLGRDHWAGIIATAVGDVGARAYLRDHTGEVREVPCDEVAEPDDVDTPEAAQRWGIAVDPPR